MDATWDELPVARERPYAVAVVVWRRRQARTEFLLLHRLAPGGPGFEGDWAWTPPAGARQPGEPPDAAAARELNEEIGLALSLTPRRGSRAGRRSSRGGRSAGTAGTRGSVSSVSVTGDLRMAFRHLAADS